MIRTSVAIPAMGSSRGVRQGWSEDDLWHRGQGSTHACEGLADLGAILMLRHRALARGVDPRRVVAQDGASVWIRRGPGDGFERAQHAHEHADVLGRGLPDRVRSGAQQALAGRSVCDDTERPDVHAVAVRPGLGGRA